MNILVTGGAGYIGSHVILELLRSDHQVTVVDNLDNSSAESLKRVEQLSGKTVMFHQFDLRDRTALETLFSENTFDAVIHFAGLKAVGESVKDPLRYYDNNLVSMLALCEVMQAHSVRQLIFSSSATVYGDQITVPIPESAALNPTNPYGQTKAMIEQVLLDLAATNEGWKISILRYFNPIGADSSGEIGEDPNGIPNNLLPYVAQVAVGRQKSLNVYGNDYDTIDGTGVRDYIHVTDLARGHLAALEHSPTPGICEIYNLGTGHGHSVLEVVDAFGAASGKPIPYTIVARRPGDIAACYADATKAEQELQWKTEKTLAEACEDAWRWQSKNPNGYH